MALTLLKRAIFDRLSFTPNTINTYRQIPRSPTSPDLERGSTSSSSSFNSNDDHNTTQSEKHQSSSQQSSPSSTPPSSSSSSLHLDPRIVSSATLGLSDGLTVPFALTAGLSTLGSAKVVIYGGLAELCAGAISMGLGGYLGAVSEIDAQTALCTQTHDLITSRPSEAHALLHETLLPLRLPPVLHNTLTAHLSDPTRTETLHHLLMVLHHHAEPEQPSPSASSTRRTQYKYAYLSALTISLGYFLGGFVPLLPYIFLLSPSSPSKDPNPNPNPNPNDSNNNITTAFWISVAVTALCLLGFGYAKVWIVGERSRRKCVVGAVQMLVLGGAAAAAAVACVWGFGGRE